MLGYILLAVTLVVTLSTVMLQASPDSAKTANQSTTSQMLVAEVSKATAIVTNSGASFDGGTALATQWTANSSLAPYSVPAVPDFDILIGTDTYACTNWMPSGVTCNAATQTYPSTVMAVKSTITANNPVLDKLCKRLGSDCLIPKAGVYTTIDGKSAAIIRLTGPLTLN